MITTHEEKKSPAQETSSPQLASGLNSSPKWAGDDDATTIQPKLDSAPPNILQVPQLSQLQAKVNQSPQVQRAAQLQAVANSSLQVQYIAQLQASANAKPTFNQGPKADLGLPRSLKASMEELSGIDLTDVQVHYNSDKPARLQAHAFAEGNHIYLAPGQEAHLAHEAWHTVQQRQGRVQSTTKAHDGTNINDNPTLEKEADEMGLKAQSLATAEKRLRPQANSETGSQSAPSGLVQRVKIIGKDGKPIDFNTLANFSVAKLIAFTDEHLDWADSLQQHEFELLFSILSFYETNNCVGIFGKFMVFEFFSLQGKLYKSLAELLEILKLGLQETSKGTSFCEPFKAPEVFASLAKFVTSMKDLQTFSTNVSKTIRKTMLADVFVKLSEEKKLDRFYEYLKLDPAPKFENSKDSAVLYKKGIDKYLKFATSSTVAKKKFIRNFHRFDLGVLAQLEKNIQDTSRKKPLTVIIYSSTDHNGALVLGDSLPPVFKDDSNLTLLIEGQESLDGFLGFAQKIAATYGVDGKIAQILICGHGSTQGVSLTGNPIEEISVKGENQPKTLDFFKKLVGLMYAYKQPSFLGGLFAKKPTPSKIDQLSRIVFSSCDVNAVVFPSKQSQINEAGGLEEFFDLNKSLVQTLISVFGAGENEYPKVLGANASVRAKSLSLIKEDGKLDLVSEQDQHLTASKIKYVEFGTMVDGVIGATAYCLEKDPENAKKAILARLNRKPMGLEEAILHAHFAFLVTQGFDSGSLLSDHVSCKKVYDRLFSIQEKKKFPFSIKEVDDAFGKTDKSLHYLKFGPLLKNIKFNNQVELELVWAQIECALSNKIAPLLNVMKNIDCQTAAPYLNWEVLKPLFEKTKAIGDTDPSLFKLAICGIVEEDEASKTFLQLFVLHEGKHFNPKYTEEFKKCIKGFSSISSLEALFKLVVPKAPSTQSVERTKQEFTYSANVTPSGSKRHTVYVEPKISCGNFVKSKITLNRLPEDDFVSSDEKEKGTTEEYTPQKAEQVHILGETKLFYAIRSPKGKSVVFVLKNKIEKTPATVKNFEQDAFKFTVDFDVQNDIGTGDLNDLVPGLEIDFEFELDEQLEK